VPGLLAATFLGVTSGGHATASVSPKATTIVTELSAHHELPKGTRLTIGDLAKPTTVTYNARGQLVVTPPRGETFGAILARGFAEMRRLASQMGVDVAHAATTQNESASTPPASKR
jgi:hypothetical protein